jgi:prevent-host-death family protein
MSDSRATLAKWGVMATVVNLHQAKAALSQLIERAPAGEDVVIARKGRPLVRLVAVPKAREPRVPGRGRDKIWVGPDFEFTDVEITELFEAQLFPEHSRD